MDGEDLDGMVYTRKKVVVGQIWTCYYFYVDDFTTPFNWLPPTPSIITVDALFMPFPRGMVTFLVADVGSVEPVFYLCLEHHQYCCPSTVTESVVFLVRQGCSRVGAWSLREAEAGDFGFDGGVDAGLDGSGVGRWDVSCTLGVHGVG